jgi:ammonia channel protein AmtB
VRNEAGAQSRLDDVIHSIVRENLGRHTLREIMYGAGWNGVGAATYLGQAGQGVTGLLYGDTSQFLCQLMGATLCAVYAFGLTYGVFSVVNAIKTMRVAPEIEREGLDVPEFGLPAYPEDALPAES